MIFFSVWQKRTVIFESTEISKLGLKINSSCLSKHCQSFCSPRRSKISPISTLKIVSRKLASWVQQQESSWEAFPFRRCQSYWWCNHPAPTQRSVQHQRKPSRSRTIGRRFATFVDVFQSQRSLKSFEATSKLAKPNWMKMAKAKSVLSEIWIKKIAQIEKNFFD